MKTQNIIPFERKPAQKTPQQNQIEFELFLFSVNALTDILSVILPALLSIKLDEKDNDIIEFYQRHVAVINDYQKAIKNPR